MTQLAEPGVPTEFETFRRHAYGLTGVDLTSYKAPQMYRRLAALLSRLQVADFAEYARLLERDAVRRQEFRDYVTINVSEFFRDNDRFAELERRVLPELLSASPSLRVWSAGCSIGAEPYSFAILLRELAPNGAHSVLATDLDHTILDRARTGADYPPADVRNVAPDRLRKWFTVDPNGSYTVNTAARASVRFARHDLLCEEYPRGPFDLIACRNVVIYFTEHAKERIYHDFAEVLRPGGVLFVGGTEAILRPQSLALSVISPGFYRKEA